MKIVFLDIDGVLQPYDAENRFYFNDETLVEELSKKHNINYHDYSIYDVMAVYYDWDEQAVARLKYILEKTNAKIIISSDWRSEKKPHKMHDLLAIHNLSKYWFADNQVNHDYIPNPKRRALEIKDSLDRYPIEEFVVLDDMPGLDEYFPENAVKTSNCIGVNDMEKSIKILNRKLDK